MRRNGGRHVLLAAVLLGTCNAVTVARVTPAQARAVGGTSALQSSSDRLRQALPLKWLHVPKTGSSFLNALIHLPGVCPGIHPGFSVDRQHCGDFFEGRFNTHCKASCPGLSCPPAPDFPHEEKPAPCSPTMPTAPTARSSLPGWRVRTQEHHLGVEPHYDLMYKGHAVTMLRQPEHRLLSAYEDNANGWPAAELQKDRPSSLLEFAQVMQGCYVRLFTRAGRVCGSAAPATAEELALAKARLRDGFAFVGITEEWDLSMCLFHAMFGGDCTAQDSMDTRPGKIGKATDLLLHNMSALGGFRDPYDGELYDEAKRVFAQNLEAFGVSHGTCSACYSQLKR